MPSFNTFTFPFLLLEDLETRMHPNTNLYYNRLTHKLEYYHTPSSSAAPVDAGRGLHSQPSVEGQKEETYGEITSYSRSGRRGSYESFKSCLEDDDVKQSNNEGIVDDRRDSGKYLTGAPKPKHQRTIDKVARQTSRLLLADTSSDSSSDTSSSSDSDSDDSIDPAPLPSLPDSAYLYLDLRHSTQLTTLPHLLSARETDISQLQHLNIIHHIIESADVEDFATTHVAKTTFSSHTDGSISAFTHAEIGHGPEQGEGTGEGCVCALEAVFRSLFDGEGEKEVREPEHVKAKRKMWRRLSATSKVETVRDQGLEYGELVRTPLTVLMQRFVALLRPKLGSDFALAGEGGEVECGLELFERPVCGAVELGRDTAVHCTRRSFLVSGVVEGVRVDVLGCGRRGEGQSRST